LAERFILSEFAYAHRGLWSPAGPPENSLAACLAAANEGLGIEFDVRPSADDVPMVFHDAILDRMTGETGLFETYTAAELSAMPLNNGGTIFSLETLLAEWPGTTPLLCEIKIDGKTDPKAFAGIVGAMLNAYSGPAASMSFSRTTVLALPSPLMHGQLINAKSRTGEDFFYERLHSITSAQADYIGCHTSDAEEVRRHADQYDLPVIVWTVEDAETCARLKPIVDAQIFSGFAPSLVKPSRLPDG